MKVYRVGGCVRDELLGIEPKDIDYVVVGSSEEEMLRLGYSQVGAGFPVFLHPTTGDEYALARKERKTGVGYNGFAVEFNHTVTLEEDLSRRDLTINAMAKDLGTGEIIDPFGGRKDLALGCLRHVSDAFAEDPIRVLRTARFAARYGFKIAPETLQLMTKVAAELEYVPKERIWTEFQKGLMEKRPLHMVATLSACGALEVPVMRPYSQPDAVCLNAVRPETPLAARFTMCASAFIVNDYDEYCIPTECSRVAKAFDDVAEDLMFYMTSTAAERIRLFQRLRAFNDTVLLESVIDCFMLLQAKGVLVEMILRHIYADLVKAKTVDVQTIMADGVRGKEIGDRLFAARVKALG